MLAIDFAKDDAIIFKGLKLAYFISKRTKLDGHPYKNAGQIKRI